jgi:hypothetical protein
MLIYSAVVFLSFSLSKERKTTAEDMKRSEVQQALHPGHKNVFLIHDIKD